MGKTVRRLLLLVLAAATPAAAQETGVAVTAATLPAAGASWRGGTHVFAGGEARLTCSSHGGFTSAVEPPAAPGASVIADYEATFTGELSLGPAIDATTYRIAGPVHMAERLSFASRAGGTLALETELVLLDLRGGGMPDGVLVRESPPLASLGRTTIAPGARGRHRVVATYDVWLELSTDGGRSWRAQEAPVRMTLVPAPVRARISTGS